MHKMLAAFTFVTNNDSATVTQTRITKTSHFQQNKTFWQGNVICKSKPMQLILQFALAAGQHCDAIYQKKKIEVDTTQLASLSKFT
jgi:hypothetical protein